MIGLRAVPFTSHDMDSIGGRGDSGAQGPGAGGEGPYGGKTGDTALLVSGQEISWAGLAPG